MFLLLGWDVAAQEPSEQGGGGGAGRRVFGERGLYRGKQLRWGTGDVGVGVHDPVEHRGGRAGPERWPAGCGEHDRQGPGEHIGRGSRITVDLLGRHETGRSDGHAGTGQRGRVRDLRDTEVDDSWPVGTQHHVRRFEIAVHHTGGVDRGERGRQSQRYGPDPVRCQWPARGDLVGHRQPANVVHHQERAGGVAHHRQDARGARAVHAGESDRLAPEPRPEPGVGGELGVHLLDRDQLPVSVVGQEHHAHAARAQPADQPVATDGGWIIAVQRRQSHPPSSQAAVGAACQPPRPTTASTQAPPGRPGPHREPRAGRLRPGDEQDVDALIAVEDQVGEHAAGAERQIADRGVGVTFGFTERPLHGVSSSMASASASESSAAGGNAEIVSCAAGSMSME